MPKATLILQTAGNANSVIPGPTVMLLDISGNITPHSLLLWANIKPNFLLEGGLMMGCVST